MKIKVIKTGEILDAEISFSYDEEIGFWTGYDFYYPEEVINLEFEDEGMTEIKTLN